jgi:small subunit ribosomal protein S3
MGQKTIVNSLHLIKNKNWNSTWYVDYNNYIYIFREDLDIYFYIRSQSKIKYNVLKRKHLFQIEIIKSLIYRTKNSTILNLHLIYLKKKILNKKTIQYFIRSLILKLKKIFFYKTNGLLVSYKVGKSTALFIALKIAKLLEKRIRFQSRIVEKLIKQVSCIGICIICKGRLNLVDRAKKDRLSFGSVPLQSMNVNIDYGVAVANTKKGLQSIKIWVFKKSYKQK